MSYHCEKGVCESTQGISRWQVDRAVHWLGNVRLLSHTLHGPTTAPLLRGECVEPAGSVGSITVQVGPRWLGQGGPILDPNHGHVLWIEATEVAGQGEGWGVGSRRYDGQSDLREDWGKRESGKGQREDYYIWGKWNTSIVTFVLYCSKVGVTFHVDCKSAPIKDNQRISDGVMGTQGSLLCVGYEELWGKKLR